jgi:formylglycine-generating enzyme required for sulfatase activity
MIARSRIVGAAVVVVSVRVLVAVDVATETRVPVEDRAAFIEVPGGDFTMGTDKTRDPEAFDNERWSPASGQGRVFVPTFYTSRREVSVGEYAMFVREQRWPADPRALSGSPMQPVTSVSWPDALAYCRWVERTLTSDASLPARLKDLFASGWRVTLPSEAEWEKAAGVLDRDQFSWGRVSEWTRSPYQPYPYDPSDDRAGLDADALWVIRGGVLGDTSTRPRLTARTGADPGARRSFIGFRVVLSRRE